MIHCLQSAAKLNLSLRVLGRRSDGYHELRSLFYALPSVESLTIEPVYGHNVKSEIYVSGDAIRGRNILEDVLSAAGRRGGAPALRIRLHKVIPPGSGLGGGSGNAAALISWLNAFLCEGCEIVGEEVGSDVPFFVKGERWALVGGRGERVEPVGRDMPSLRTVVVVPSWSISTARAFSLLSAKFRSGFPLKEAEAVAERREVLEKLAEGRILGLLPNDFCAVLLEEHPEYSDLFGLLRDSGAIAWGITGSGSAAFGLYPEERGFPGSIQAGCRMGWIRKILFLE